MFKYEKLNASKTVRLSPVERVVEFTPSGVDAENLAKILSLAVDGRIINAVAYDGYVEAEGRANFKMVYLDADGNLKGVDYNADFSVRLTGEVTAGSPVTAEVAVQEADASKGMTLTLSAVIVVSACVTEREELEYLADAEDSYKTMETAAFPSFIAAKSAVVPIEEESRTGEIGSVLSLDASVVATGCTASENAVTVDFSVYATVVYTEDGEMKSTNYEIKESEELSVEGAEEGDTVLPALSLSNMRVILAGVTGENVLRLEGDVNVKIQVFRTRETELVKDMFMLTNEVDTERSERKYVCEKAAVVFNETVSGTITLGDAANEILVIPSSRAYVAKAEVTEDGGALVEGLVTADIVFTDENGINSVRAEIPFSLTLGENFGGQILSSATVKSVTAKLKKGTEIDVSADLIILIYSQEEIEAGYIARVTVGEAKETNKSGLSLYIASEGDVMWDICKALTATPESIMLQNPALSVPLAEGEKVIYFRALTL